jgi:pimeloyl-ACP methyl ester carboxylesterase
VTARLHREPIAQGAPARWLALTHGIFGSGANWRSVARQVVAARPDWGVVLVDLRGHGKSEDGDPPHDVPACATDVRALVGELAATHPVRALGGHSFGGKVMLATRAAWPAGEPLDQTWILDSTPGPRPDLLSDPHNSVTRVLAMLAELPPRWAKRADFVRAVAGTADGPQLANWLAMSLVPDGDGLRLRLEPAMLRALLADYYTRDLWPAVEDPARPGAVRVVAAGRSPTVSAADRARAAAAPRTTVDVIDAGHWLHVDAPDPVVALFARGLPA